MRILILGCPGSGKTTLAKNLGEVLSLPIFHLDDYYWQSNWLRPNCEEWIIKVKQISEAPRWIIDGNHYSSLMPRVNDADVVLFLNAPMLICLYRAFKRMLKRWKGDRSSLPLRIREDEGYKNKFSINCHFITLILFFNWKMKPKVINEVKRANKKLIILKNNSSICDILLKIREGV